MRRATIVINWEGPDKDVRTFIEARIDTMFEDLSMELPKVTFADASVTFQPKVSTARDGDPSGRSAR